MESIEKQVEISEKQRDNLCKELAKLVYEIKEENRVECIYFAPYTHLGEEIQRQAIKITVVKRQYEQYEHRDDYAFDEMNEKYKSDKEFAKLGFQIYIATDANDKYTTLPLNPSERLRGNQLFNSYILFDRIGVYTEIKKEVDSIGVGEHSSLYYYDNRTEIIPPIEEDIEQELENESVRVFTKTPTFAFLKDMK